MNPINFDFNKLREDFSGLLLSFLLDGYSNARFDMPFIKSLAKFFVDNPQMINTPDQAPGADDNLKQDLLLLLKHAQIMQIQLHTTSLISHLSDKQQLSELDQQLSHLLDFLNRPPYSH